MISQHSIIGFSQINTLRVNKNQINYSQLENLNWQVKPPQEDEYFDHGKPKKNFSISREDYCETRESAYHVVSIRPFSLWNKFLLKFSPDIVPIKYNKGLLRSGYWYFRHHVCNANDEEFFAYHLHPEDINFNTNFFKEYRIKLTIIYNNSRYISINAFDFLTIGDVFDGLLKCPIWSNYYSFTVSDNLHKFDILDFMFKIKYFVDHNILHDGSIILISKNSRFLF